MFNKRFFNYLTLTFYFLFLSVSLFSQNTLDKIGYSSSDPKATGAYSLRLLSTSYTGNAAIRVRRSTDNSTMDIGFDASGNLDQSGLLAFVGSGSGFVATWYDQSGNSNHVTQSTFDEPT